MSRTVQEIFDLLLSMPTELRAAELAKLCGDDLSRRADVESLLRAHEAAGEFLARPTISPKLPNPGATSSLPPGAPSAASAKLTEAPGDMVDRYKLLQKIGEGGFGVVYMAQQNEPIRRRVALKIIKLGMDTRHVVARFEAERQALAVMDHPNIARVIDGGSTQTGRPYFVMELVRGEPITDYCDQNKLTLRSRLELFQQVCRAIAHAHQKGIIHRDIKPNNVLVTVADSRPLAKVIDFGIAKATTADLTEKTLFTEFRQLLGTPLYMSPEQAQRSGVDVDTRTDIYSLGVLLYEILTGRTPLDPQKLSSATWFEWQRMIVEDEPSRPSLLVSSGESADLMEVARRRGVEASRLGTILRGDLDWIVLKAIDKDRSRRYETVAALHDDIDRFLKGEAVLATPPSRRYRMKKFIARNRGWLSTAAALLLMLVIGLAATSVAATWAIRNANAAKAALRLAEANERQARRAAVLASASQTLPETEARALSKSWLADIDSMPTRSEKAAAQREIQKAQHAAWLASWLARNNKTDEAAQLIEASYAHVKQWLGQDSPSFLELCNARIITMEQRETGAADYAAAYDDLIVSLRSVRGETSAAPLLPQWAAALLKANRLGDAKAAVEQFAAQIANGALPLSPEVNARLDGAIDRIMNWDGLGSVDSNPEAAQLLRTLREIRTTGNVVATGADAELDNDLELMQGTWRHKRWERGQVVEHMVVEFTGHQCETRFLDESGATIRGRQSRFELTRSGGVKVLKAYQGETPEIGGAFVYEIRPSRPNRPSRPTRLVLVSGLLQNETGLPEIRLRDFYRVKHGEPVGEAPADAPTR
ncbi:MAG: serine/threonine protein kinase [Planctomycetales bacterium]|nr:serine/threonine protein kinase [Planctomycetales bacterium]